MKWVITLLMFAYIALNLPVFHDGLFHVYDNVQVTRVEAYFNELKAGQFPVRYLSEFGHGAGYFLPKYYSPLVYYLGSAFMTLGLNGIKAVKLVYLLMSLLGVVGIWKLTRLFSRSNLPAVLGSLAFISSPYLFHDLYHRGSLTEASAMLASPWVIWAFVSIIRRKSWRSLATGAVTLGIIFLLHSLTAIMILGVLMVLLVVERPAKTVVVKYLGAILLGLGIASFNLIPAISERHLVSYENNSLLARGYIDHPIKMSAQFANQGVGEEKSAFLGLSLICTLILLAIMLFSKTFRKNYGKMAIFCLFTAAGGLYLMTPASAFWWERIVYLRYFQFPFRMLSVVTLVLALGVTVTADYFEKRKWITALLVLTVILPPVMGSRYYQTLGYQYGTTYTVDDPCMSSTWADEYMSKWTTKCLTEPRPLVSERTIEVLRDGARLIELRAHKAGEYEVARYYFPEWKGYTEDGGVIELSPSGEHGLIKFTTTDDNQTVLIRLEKTRASKLGDWASAISILAALILLTKQERGVQKS